ncbi:cytochrome c oxidase subunit 3 [Methyloversatilis sp.]|uniref:cytochrome c oxidase subunit 3 n=1 Tax=Methyloversatilis sp. TaxID=2569862 RepID=UPI003D2AB85E
MSSHTPQQAPYYYVPAPSTYPITGSIALFLFALGSVLTMNKITGGGFVLGAGVLVLFYMMYSWFGKVAHESEGGLYSKRVGVSFRWAMGWFIFSEVMFFAAFFGALFYARVLAMPDLASLEHQALLWPDAKAMWPNAGPGYDGGPFTPMGAWGIPAINTLLLLTSGVTLTWAHHGLLHNNRGQLKLGLFLTIALGVVFLGFQAYEYMHAYSDLNVKMTTGVFGSVFYMLTGFHGFHVTVGATMLIVILCRVFAGHFSPENHFGFEAVAWYWHFVNVVWLLLFVVVYWI